MSSQQSQNHSNLPHRRYNPLIDEWVIVSPHRMNRPWSGQLEMPELVSIPRNDPENPLCPGSTRSSGVQNPNYESTFIFENDFPALLDNESGADADKETNEDDIFRSAPAYGSCKVMCFHPWSDLTLPLMKASEVLTVIDKWCDLVATMSKLYTWIQIFENRGSVMGCSNPHPHCQIWSTKFLPNVPTKKHNNQKAYYDKHKSVLLVDYVKKEIDKQERIVSLNDHWVCLVPYWATWPYETLLLPRRHVLRLCDLSDAEKLSLVGIVQDLLVRYDNLFKCSFPYSMGWHGAPTGSYLEENCQHWQLHAAYYPPLLRSSTVKKFMVGYEMLAEMQRDLTPEKAAETLRALPVEHYLCDVDNMT